MKDVKREFYISDSLMLQKSNVFLSAFIKNKAIFVAKSPLFDDPFADEFQAAIEFATHLPFSHEINSIISVSVEKLNKKMIVSQQKLQILFMYVKIGWNTKAKLKEFGKDKYQKSRKSFNKMIDLLEFANRQSEENENKSVLLSVGYSQLEIDELNVIADELKSLYLELEDLKSNRYILTYERITAMNNVWEFMKKINQISKVAFEKNPAMLKIFLLYPTSHSKSKLINEKTEGAFEEA